MPQFPFVIIPDSMNAISIRREYPFLFLVIMVVSTEGQPALQKTLDYEVKRTVSTRIIMNNERNIDLLLGLLVYTAWYHYHWESMLPHMYLFLQLTVTMAADLGLDREPNFTMRNIAAGLGRPTSAHQLSEGHSAAGKRALLGTFYLCSVSSLFRQQLFMKHTNWINQCCDDLMKNPEFPSDQLLKRYIEVRLLAQKSAEVFSGNFHRHTHSPSNGERRLEARIQELNNEFGLFQGIKYEDREQGSNTCAYVFEMNVKPVIVLGQIVYHRNGAFLLDEMDQLDDLISSAESFISSFLETLPEIAIHLPLSFYTYLWIKCDEVRPACNGCLRHSVVCDYQLEEASSNANSQPVVKAPKKVAAKRHTFISSYQSNFKTPKRAHRTRKSLVTQLLQFSSSGRILPALPCRPFEFSIVDMELFHNFVSPTDYGASDYQSATRLYHSQLTRLGFSFPYVLRLLLACSGFQLARRPEIMQQQQSAIQRKDYHVVAERHYNIAIREVAVEVPRLNKENCHAIYTAAVHIFISSLAMGPRPGEYMAFRDDGQPGLLSLFMGVRTVLEISSKLFSPDVVLKGDEGESGSGSESNAGTIGCVRSSTIASEYGYWMDQLRHLIESELGTQDPRYSNYYMVFERLHQCYDALYSPFSPITTALLWPCLFGWLYRLPDVFMFAVQQRDQPALVIFSYFVVLLNELTWNWFLENWPTHILTGIHRNLDVYHQQYMQWPMHCVTVKV
ncbi:C6 transcription factor [Aspergillus bombycis]|uniref:C6 transcription factor n=1 Tax=Aspergillus bombycis TaxID=109264 RepID=A0A1F7ZTP4_9EURO|nr:C6 transcription factor [Aspergillus bombycis]OGM42797.1 C6 transcription factor [Aspergillus bombycis]